MTKKLLGLGTMALFCVGMASASTLIEDCSGGAGANGSVTDIPTASGTATCPAFTIPSGDTLTQVTLILQGDFQLGNSGGNTLNWTYTVNNPVNGITLNGGATEAVSGSGGGSSSYTWSADTGCTAPDSLETPTPLVDGADCNTGVNFTNPSTSTFGGFTVGISGSWNAGSAGLQTNGSEGATVVEAIFTYTPTGTVPEPSTLMMIGGGLVGLVVVSRRRRKV
jgi:hypothetical protein